MRIAPSGPPAAPKKGVEPGSPGTPPAEASAAFTVEAAKLAPGLGPGLGEYLRLNPAHFLLSGAAIQAGLGQRWLAGQPITLGTNLVFQPMAAPRGETPAASTAPGEVRAETPMLPVIARAAQVAGLVDACRGPMEEFAKTHSNLDTSLDVLGLVTATPQMWNALVQPGPKNKAELALVGAQVGVWAAKIASDFVPGMHAVKPALMWTGILLQAGEQVHAIIVKPVKP